MFVLFIQGQTCAIISEILTHLVRRQWNFYFKTDIYQSTLSRRDGIRPPCEHDPKDWRHAYRGFSCTWWTPSGKHQVGEEIGKSLIFNSLQLIVVSRGMGYISIFKCAFTVTKSSVQTMVNWLDFGLRSRPSTFPHPPHYLPTNS